MRAFLLGLAAMLALVGCSAAEGAPSKERFAPGEALVVFKLPEGAAVTESSLVSGDLRIFVEGAASSVGARVVTIYEALSGANGNIFVLLRSRTKSTEELLEALQERPDVVAASPNRRLRLTNGVKRRP